MPDDSASAILSDCARVWQEQRLLCDTLEEIADSLPDRIDRQACMHAARVLPALVSRAHRVEEDGLFAALERLGPAPLDVGPTLSRLRLEHQGDQCFAEELSEVLMSFGRSAPIHDAEALGYMLRGFFETLRRHIATEEELSVLLVRRERTGPQG